MQLPTKVAYSHPVHTPTTLHYTTCPPHFLFSLHRTASAGPVDIALPKSAMFLGPGNSHTHSWAPAAEPSRQRLMQSQKVRVAVGEENCPGSYEGPPARRERKKGRQKSLFKIV
jgi:hypothetical protein